MYYSNASLLTLFFCIYSVICCAQHDVVRSKVVKTALQYEGLTERQNLNDGPIFNYMRSVENQKLNDYKGMKPATCGFFVNMVFKESGFDLKCVPDRGMAFSYLKCPDKVLFGRATTKSKVERLKVGMIVVYDFSHVGIITGVYPTYITTIESNTSTSNTVHNYRYKKGGIYEKIRKYSFIWYVTDCAKCAVPFDNKQVLQLKKIYQPFKNQ